MSTRREQNESALRRGVECERNRRLHELQARATAEELAAADLDPGAGKYAWHLGRASILREICRELLLGGDL